MDAFTLPDRIHPYPDKTLLIVSAHEKARVFILEDRDLLELPILHTEATDYQYSDKEGFTYNSKGQGSVPGFAETDRQHYEHLFTNYLAEQIRRLDETQAPKQIFIFGPNYLKYALLKKLPQPIAEKTTVSTANYFHLPVIELLEAVEKKMEE